jgi:hypothetical protein
MPGLVDLLDKNKTDLEIIQYSFTDSDILYLESEPHDLPILLTGDCFFEKQETGLYHLIAITNYTTSNNFLPLIAQLLDEDEDIALAHTVEFIQEKPFATSFKSRAELSLLLNLADIDTDLLDDLDNEDCAPDSQISCKWPHGSSASPGGMFNQPRKQTSDPDSILDIELIQNEETQIAAPTA